MIFNALYKNDRVQIKGAALLVSRRSKPFLTKLMTGNKSGALLLTTFVLNRRGGERRQRSIYLFGVALRLSLVWRLAIAYQLCCPLHRLARRKPHWDLVLLVSLCLRIAVRGCCKFIGDSETDARPFRKPS